MILHIMIVANLALINFVENFLHQHIILLADTTILHHLVTRYNLTLVHANAPLEIKTPLLPFKRSKSQYL